MISVRDHTQVLDPKEGVVYQLVDDQDQEYVISSGLEAELPVHDTIPADGGYVIVQTDSSGLPFRTTPYPSLQAAEDNLGTVLASNEFAGVFIDESTGDPVQVLRVDADAFPASDVAVLEGALEEPTHDELAPVYGIEVQEDLMPYKGEENVEKPTPEAAANGDKLFIQDANGQVFYIQCPEEFSVDKSHAVDPEKSPSASSKRLSAWVSTVTLDESTRELLVQEPVEEPDEEDEADSVQRPARKRPLSLEQFKREFKLNPVKIRRQMEKALPPLSLAPGLGSPDHVRDQKRKKPDSQQLEEGALPPLSLAPHLSSHPNSRTDKQKNQEKVGQRVKALTIKLKTEFEKAKGNRRDPGKNKEEPKYESGLDPLTGEVKGPEADPAILSSTVVEREVKTSDDICKVWALSPKDKVLLKKKGISWREGPWCDDEVEILDENIKNYCLEKGYQDPSKVIFSMTAKERKNFYPQITRGLHRPVFSVYRRVQRDYDPNNHKGVYSVAELEKLNDLLELHGTDYKLIAETLGRSLESVRDRCRHLHDGRVKPGKQYSTVGFQKGKWKPSEEKKLVVAVHEVKRRKLAKDMFSRTMYNITQDFASIGRTADGSDGLDQVPWSEVSSLVRTRNGGQCRRKWYELIKRHEEKTKGETDEVLADVGLLKELDMAAIEDAAENVGFGSGVKLQGNILKLESIKSLTNDGEVNQEKKQQDQQKTHSTTNVERQRNSAKKYAIYTASIAASW